MPNLQSGCNVSNAGPPSYLDVTPFAKTRLAYNNATSCSTVLKRHGEIHEVSAFLETESPKFERSSPLQKCLPAQSAAKILLQPLLGNTSAHCEFELCPAGMHHVSAVSSHSSSRASLANIRNDGHGNMDALTREEMHSRTQSADRKIRRRKHKSVSRRRRSISNASSVRPSGSDADVSAASLRKQKMAEFEATRRQASANHDRALVKLLQSHAVPTCPDPQLTIAQRRANYESCRKERMLLHRQRVEQAKKLVRERLEECRPCEAFIQRVIVDVLIAAKLYTDEMALGCEVSEVMFEQCCEKAKLDFYTSRIDEEMVKYGVTSLLWRKEVAKGIVQNVQVKELAEAEARGFSTLIRDAIQRMITAGSSIISCPICMFPLVSISDRGELDLSNMWCAALRKNEHWSNHACGHTFCRSCMERWAETAVNEHKVRIRCPAEHCSYSLWDQDLVQLLSRSMFIRYKEHKHADYLQNLRTIADKDDNLMRWLRQHARPCPECHVIVSRSEGCNTMTCVCGTRFCYACGCQPCQCGNKSKDDIWKPNP